MSTGRSHSPRPSSEARVLVTAVSALVLVGFVVMVLVGGGTARTDQVDWEERTEEVVLPPVSAHDQGVVLPWWEPGLVWEVSPQRVLWPGASLRESDRRAGIPSFIQIPVGGFLEAAGRPVRDPDLLGVEPAQARNQWLLDLEVSLGQYGFEWVYPIRNSLKAGSPYGSRKNPVTHKWQLHEGHDIGCRLGELVYAVADGEVVRSGSGKSTGNVIKIDHGEADGLWVSTRYLHLLDRRVSTGQKVERGQPIGRCGSTGRSTSPHLHFEVLEDEEPVPPLWRWATTPGSDVPLSKKSSVSVIGRSVERIDRIRWNRWVLEANLEDFWHRDAFARGELWVYAPTLNPVGVVLALPDWNDESATSRAAFGALVEEARAHNIAVAVASMGTSVYASVLYPDASPGFRWCGYDCEVPGLQWLGEVVVPMLGEWADVKGVLGVGMGAKGALLLGQRYGLDDVCAMSGPYLTHELPTDTIAYVTHREAYGDFEQRPYRWLLDDVLHTATEYPVRRGGRALILHGERDPDVPSESARQLAAELRSKGWVSKLRVIEGQTTGWKMWSRQLDTCMAHFVKE